MLVDSFGLPSYTIMLSVEMWVFPPFIILFFFLAYHTGWDQYNGKWRYDSGHLCLIPHLMENDLNIGIPRFIVLRFIEMCKHCFFFFFTNLVCGNPASSRFIDVIFQRAFAYFLSLCHIWYKFLQSFKNFCYYVTVSCD